MRACQSPDQFVAGAWPRGQVPALTTIPRHQTGLPFHVHGGPSSRQAVSATPGRVVRFHTTLDSHICARTITHVPPVRAYYPTNHICARNRDLKTVSFYDALNRQTKVIDALGGITTSVF